VAFAARRIERLEEMVRTAGKTSIAIGCDIRHEASCTETVERAVSAFGGLDAIVYAPGISTFQPLREIDAATWHAVLDTNLVGATRVTRAAIGHLEESCGKAIYLSSISIDDAPPRFANAPYVVSKVALEALVRAWQGEHRRVGFTTVAMGDTMTEFARDEDPEQLIDVVKGWAEQDYMYGRMMEAPSVAAQVVNALASSETVRRIAITPHYPHEDATPNADWGSSAIEEARKARGD
jgi:NAD(P)-dependent dehydrogenase (short-subunit alcohol dehydrogenase family)